MVKKMRFSDQLRRLVVQSDLTRYRISRRTGIAQSILSRFINQGAGLSMKNIDKLCECLELQLTAKRKRRKRKG